MQGSSYAMAPTMLEVERLRPDDEMLGMLLNDEGNDDCSEDWNWLKPPPMARPPPNDPICAAAWW